MDLASRQEWFRDKLLERFQRYVALDTTSDRHSLNIPSTPGQRVLAEMLANEIRSLGITSVSVDDNSYLYASIAATAAHINAPPFGLIAHLDTSADAPGKNVNPIIHKNYDGKPIRLSSGYTLDLLRHPELAAYRGTTIITSDGTTLLGADDKAGIAEIMTFIEFMTLDPKISHGPIEIVFTPDEETGHGMDHFPLSHIKSQFCLTLDGSGDSVIEAECFTAYAVSVAIEGKSIHLGEARGKLINAIQIASKLVTLLPGQESPEATDGRFGYYAPIEIRGDLEQAAVEFLIRDFNETECTRRISVIRATCDSLEKLYPGAIITITPHKQYSNMKKFFGKKEKQNLALLEKAVYAAGGSPVYKSIRGGTDGARLSEQGIPTPNLFTGGFCYHSRNEWAALEAMARAVCTLIHFCLLWAKNFSD